MGRARYTEFMTLPGNAAFKLKAQRVPSFGTPPFTYPASFQHNVLSSSQLQIMAHAEPGLPGANDDSVNSFGCAHLAMLHAKSAPNGKLSTYF